jgi:hypothetical protein
MMDMSRPLVRCSLLRLRGLNLLAHQLRDCQQSENDTSNSLEFMIESNIVTATE